MKKITYILLAAVVMGGVKAPNKEGLDPKKEVPKTDSFLLGQGSVSSHTTANPVQSAVLDEIKELAEKTRNATESNAYSLSDEIIDKIFGQIKTSTRPGANQTDEYNLRLEQYQEAREKFAQFLDEFHRQQDLSVFWLGNRPSDGLGYDIPRLSAKRDKAAIIMVPVLEKALQKVERLFSNPILKQGLIEDQTATSFMRNMGMTTQEKEFQARRFWSFGCNKLDRSDTDWLSKTFRADQNKFGRNVVEGFSKIWMHYNTIGYCIQTYSSYVKLNTKIDLAYDSIRTLAQFVFGDMVPGAFNPNSKTSTPEEKKIESQRILRAMAAPIWGGIGAVTGAAVAASAPVTGAAAIVVGAAGAIGGALTGATAAKVASENV